MPSLSKEACHKLPLCCCKHVCVCKVLQNKVAIWLLLFLSALPQCYLQFRHVLIRCCLYLFKSQFSYQQFLSINGLDFVAAIGAQWLLHNDHKLWRFKVNKNLPCKLNVFLLLFLLLKPRFCIKLTTYVICVWSLESKCCKLMRIKL